MGSLMAGWNCPVVDAETARLERNRSLTKGEIESFWKVRRRSCDDGEEQDEQAVLSPSSTGPRSPPSGGEGDAVVDRKKSLFWQSLEKSKTFPSADPHSPVSADKVTKLAGDWWTRSNWAFLNEPPHEETDESSLKYTPQFHVARIATATEKQQPVA